MRKLKPVRKCEWSENFRGSRGWNLLCGTSKRERERERKRETEGDRGESHTWAEERAATRRGLGVGRPRLSAIKIIPFLLAAERKELTSTLSGVHGYHGYPRGATLFLFLATLLSASSYSLRLTISLYGPNHTTIPLFLFSSLGPGKHSYFNCVVLRQDDQSARDGAE